MYARLGVTSKELKREVNRLAIRIDHSGMNYNKEKINTMLELVEAPNIDYYKIVGEVETIL